MVDSIRLVTGAGYYEYRPDPRIFCAKYRLSEQYRDLTQYCSHLKQISVNFYNWLINRGK